MTQRSTEADIQDVKRRLTAKTKRPKAPSGSSLLSSGATLLDLACSGSARGAYSKGQYIFFVGDSDSGKTWYTMSMFAEAAHNKNFDNYRLIYDAVEGGAQMDVEYYFGEATADRIEPPSTDSEGNAQPSAFLEDFYINIDRLLDGGKPIIYALDSMDSLNPREADEKFDEDAQNIEAGKDTGGTYGTAKAKLNSNNLRRIIPKLRATGSILVIISQTRDTIGRNAMFNPKTRGGGRALTFYADIEVWTSVKGSIAKTVRKKKRNVGIRSVCKVKRSRLTGRKAEVEVPFYHQHGIDDVGSCVAYLIEEEHWKKVKGGKAIAAPEFEFEGTEEKLIAHIEEISGEKELKSIVAAVWGDVIEASCVKRKRRYD